MKLLLQRVKKAEVSVEGYPSRSIEKGILVFLGIHKLDTVDSIDSLVSKLVNLRIFPDENGKMNASCLDIKGSILVISQFTLYGDCSEGRRPSFFSAAGASIAEPLYEQFLLKLRAFPLPVISGYFGADMQVSLINDGPVTLILESKS